MVRWIGFVVVFVGSVLVAGGVGFGQDTRVVTEPKIPPVCVRLEAELELHPDANGGTLNPADEGQAGHGADTEGPGWMRGRESGGAGGGFLLQWSGVREKYCLRGVSERAAGYARRGDAAGG